MIIRNFATTDTQGLTLGKKKFIYEYNENDCGTLRFWWCHYGYRNAVHSLLGRAGTEYLNEEDFGRRIKGQTLLQIYEKYFSDQPEAQLEISAELYVYEQKMSYEYIPGVEAL